MSWDQWKLFCEFDDMERGDTFRIKRSILAELYDTRRQTLYEALMAELPGFWIEWDIHGTKTHVAIMKPTYPLRHHRHYVPPEHRKDYHRNAIGLYVFGPRPDYRETFRKHASRIRKTTTQVRNISFYKNRVPPKVLNWNPIISDIRAIRNPRFPKRKITKYKRIDLMSQATYADQIEATLRWGCMDPMHERLNKGNSYD